MIAAQRETVDVNAFFELDEQFHRSLLAAGGHGNAWRTVVAAKAHLDRARRLGMTSESSIQALTDEHAAVVDALASRDGDGRHRAAQPPAQGFHRHREDPRAVPRAVLRRQGQPADAPRRRRLAVVPLRPIRGHGAPGRDLVEIEC